MRRYYFSIALFLFAIFGTFAQGTQSSIQEQKDHYGKLGALSDKEWDKLNGREDVHHASEARSQTCTLNKRVFGWHPYWNGSTYTNYQWNLLSDMCYFDYTVDPNTGNNTNASFAWSSSAAVTAAINNGTNAHFCATLFSSHTTFLASSTAQQTFITNVISLLNSRGGKGVNIDFEGMGASHKTAFTAFMQNLCTQVHAANPNYEVSICLYAVDWSTVFDMPNLNPFVDFFTIMGYDYYYGGSTTAGPEAPLYNFQTGYNYTLAKSITYYIKAGATPSKLILGLPYYGREWETTAATAPSSTTGGFTATRTYAVVRNNASGYYPAANKNWDANSFNPFYAFQVAGAWRQTWIDDAYSMRKKFDLVNERGIGGIGIWALGYDDGYTDYWNAIQDKFSTCALVACQDTIYDMGGPARTYYDNESYTYTIAPAGASSVNLNFSQFDLEPNFDSLWLYDGASASSTLIGKYTGLNSPGSVTSTGPAITVRFKSDGATVKPGFSAVWTCLSDNIQPTTQVSAPAGWITQNFTANFTDADNVNGSGIEKSFYQVLEYTGTEWRANNQRGFFSDNFDVAIHPDWTSMTGTWAINGAYLEQNDQSLSNTNIYAPCNQMLSNRYLYNWQGKIDGTGTNRRAGFHFFCDSASTANRYNSYFVWYRLDQSTVELYKVVNDVFTLVNSAPYTYTANTFYDFKVTFDRISGEVKLWINNAFVLAWTDATPHVSGKYISFRNGNSIYTVNDLKVYRSRASSVNVSVGSANTNDIRYENTSPSTPAARIKSITKDVANNLSVISSQDLNIDWTVPVFTSTINDGIAADLDTTYSNTQLSANWTAAIDTNSAIARYWYAIGSAPGLTDLVSWTNNLLATSVTATGLSLAYNQYYYVAVKAEDGAGLACDSLVSDGILVLQPLGVSLNGSEDVFTIYPNPANDLLYIVAAAKPGESFAIKIYNSLGEIVLFEPSSSKTVIDISAYPNAVYTIELRIGNRRAIKRFIKN
ncbi:MAG: glycosyl hydrolase family 18 protein [Bacteroidia bacterium]